MKRALIRSLFSLLLASFIDPAIAFANGKPCRQGHKGGYVTWAKTGSKSGTGQFVFASGYVAVLPDSRGLWLARSIT
jgi:hypothetical protein